MTLAINKRIFTPKNLKPNVYFVATNYKFSCSTFTTSNKVVLITYMSQVQVLFMKNENSNLEIKNP